MNDLAVNDLGIKSRIFTIRNVQVMIDRDLAELYGVETRALKQAVKRNLLRFPEDFMFEITPDEVEILVSQSVIPSKKQLGGALPFAFTEQGVASLSAILTSQTAIEAHLRIMRAFVAMRRFMSQNALVFERMDAIERRQYDTDTKVDAILDAIEAKNEPPAQGVFYDGQIFDAYSFVSNLVRSAKEDIVLIDNYVDDTTLTLLSKNQQANITIYTQSISKQLALDVTKYNSQYKPIIVKELKTVHDRFLILDDEQCYLIGSSLKDLGKKLFGFSTIDRSLISELFSKVSSATGD
ncbi:MAG TPA: ORF6N domain-containing protein [Thiotrichales bacterium]|nr:MAG: ORF6N domain-containing protein [Thiotrichales bacterium]HQR82894.1 ORF6N domain-containing protein [Thiotrichales bacterium]HQR95294.1 ORF6N domain-containing protein [Thiotrichales bacterium]